jgi:two-component system, OmpR family, sensor kinase
VSRLPIRVRLTLPFAIVMIVVLVAMGTVVYVRVGSALLATVDQNLNAQVAETVSNAQQGRQLLDLDVSDGPAVAQVRRANGDVVRSSPAGLEPLVATRLQEEAAIGRRAPTTTSFTGLHGQWRAIAVPVRADHRPAVLVIAWSLAARELTLDRLQHEFLLAAPVALLFAILSGYVLAAAALRPVEAMRRRAAAVTADSPGRRLPVPRARDEISALAVTLNDMLERLEAAFEHERRFVADASHELRTPLALLRAELELALRRPRSPAEYMDAIRSAVDETDRLSRLADDLLLIARGDEGQLPIRREQLDGRDLLDRVRTRFAVRAAELDRPLAVVGGADVRFEADPARLEQALGNLVDNAFVHASGAVALSASRTNGVVELHVVDHGPGLPDGFADRAFDRFSRPDDAREGGGAGLGLAIVELIARAHGGAARVDPAPGGGADVYIAIPAE